MYFGIKLWDASDTISGELFYTFFSCLLILFEWYVVNSAFSQLAVSWLGITEALSPSQFY